jgi:seryl-tRNA(Sec) selenium transferase
MKAMVARIKSNAIKYALKMAISQEVELIQAISKELEEQDLQDLPKQITYIERIIVRIKAIAAELAEAEPEGGWEFTDDLFFERLHTESKDDTKTCAQKTSGYPKL